MFGAGPALAIGRRRSSLVAVLRACAVGVLFAVSACRLFAGLGQPPGPSEPLPEPVAAAPEPVEAAPEPVAAPEVQPPSAAVELSALQAALGRTADDPAVRELVARLGTPAVADAGDRAVHAFAEHGVVLRFADGRIAEVALFAAGEGYSAWRGALPGGLRFGMSDYEVERSLGVAMPLREVGWRGDARVLRSATEGGRTLRGHGVRVHFGRGGLAVVALLPATAPGSVHLDDVMVYPSQENGVRGLQVHYQISVGAPAGCEALDVAVTFEDPAGAPIRARSTPSRRGRPAAFTAVDEDVPCARADRAVFVPFGGLELPAGSHAVRVHLAAGRAAKKRAIAEARGRAEFTMPPVVLVRLKVSRAQIRGDVFARRNIASVATFGLSSIFKRPKLDPDPFWVLEAGTYSHRSKVKSSTFTPRWTESTRWFPLAEGDAITLHFADEDLADNERLGVVRVSLDELRAAIRDGTPLAAGWVERIELEGSEIRAAP